MNLRLDVKQVPQDILDFVDIVADHIESIAMEAMPNDTVYDLCTVNPRYETVRQYTNFNIVSDERTANTPWPVIATRDNYHKWYTISIVITDKVANIASTLNGLASTLTSYQMSDANLFDHIKTAFTDAFAK